MAKLHLVITDTEEPYVDAIVNYLMNNHSDKFKVSSFTSDSYLIDFLNTKNEKIDVLLISPKLYNDSIPKEKILNTVILASGKVNSSISDLPTINKYQPGDMLVKNIMEILSNSDSDNIYIPQGNKKTKVIAVYSPSGGVGKTTVSLACAIRSAAKGKSVFYLNLESLQSTPLYLNCDEGSNLSDILYYIKSNNKNIGLKFEAIRCIEPKYNIHYFAPPENVVDINELLPEELESLINEIKKLNKYDAVFIDMSSDLNDKNISVLKQSDEILLILTQNGLSDTRFKSLIKNLDILCKRSGIDILDKINIVLNKYNNQITSRIESAHVNGKGILFKIPLVNRLNIQNGDRYTIDLNNGFGVEINNIIESLLT